MLKPSIATVSMTATNVLKHHDLFPPETHFLLCFIKMI